jgi:hypothetical protein
VHCPKPERDTRHSQVRAQRYRCLCCRRTFWVYPSGVTCAHQSATLKALSVLLYILGLSYQGVSDHLEALNQLLCKSSAAQLRNQYPKLVNDAARNSQRSRIAGIVAAVALAVAIGLTWYGPTAKAPSNSTYAIVIDRSGLVRCGELHTDTGGNARLKAASGGTQLEILDDLVTFLPVDECPHLSIVLIS